MIHTQATHQKHKHTETRKQKLNRLPKMCFIDLFFLLFTLIIAIIIIVIIIIIMVIITQYSKFQFKICFNEIIGS